MPPLDLLLLETAVWGGLCAGVLALWRVRLLRGVVIVQAVMVAGAAVSMLVDLLETGRQSIGGMSRGWWLHGPGWELPNRGVVQLGTPVILIGLSLAVLLSALSRGEKSAGRNDAGRFCLFQASLLFTLLADPTLKVAFLMLMTACCLFWAVSESDAVENAVAARRRFLFRFAAQGLLLLGYLDGGAAAEAAEWLLPAGLLAHVACPFFGRTRDGAAPSESRLLDRLLVTPAVLMLTPESSRMSGQHTVLLLGGAYLALMAAFSVGRAVRGQESGSQESEATRHTSPLTTHHLGLESLSLSLTGMMLAALATGHRLGAQAALLLFVSSAVVLPILAARVAAPLRWAAALVLGTGIGGTGLGAAALAQSFGPPWVDEAAIAVTACVLAGAGLLLVTFRLGQWLKGPPSLSAPDTLPVARKAKRLDAGIASLLLLAPLAFGLHGLSPWDYQGVCRVPAALPVAVCAGATLLVMAAGVVVGTATAETLGAQQPGLGPGGLLVLLTGLPLRAAAQICRFLEWLIVRSFWDAPRQLPRLLRWLGEPLQSQSARTSALVVLAATAILLGAILGLGN